MYKIADLIVELNVDGITKSNAEPYIFETDKQPDIIINQDFETAKERQLKYFREGTNAEDYRELINHSHELNEFARAMLDFNGISMHASAVVVDDKAYLFSAPSGTGKSTHTANWLKLFGDRSYILNDDVPTIRIVDDEVFAYGTPWAGSTRINKNAKAHLGGICFLTRSEQNWIKLMPSQNAIFRLFDATSKRLTKEQLEKKFAIIDGIIRRVPIYEMGCTPEIEAAQLAFDVMSKKAKG